MAFTLKQLLEEIDTDDALSELKALLSDLGFDVSDWKEGSVAQTHLQLDAYVYAQLQNRIAQMMKNTLNQHASGSALTLLAKSQFDNDRVTSKQTEGPMFVSSSAQIRPITFQSSELKVKDPTNTFIFENTEQIILNNSIPTGSFTFRAEEPGAHYNIPTGVTMSLVSTQVGLEVTNPPHSSGSSVWYTTAGRDEESDETLRQRNATKWSTIQTGDSTVDRVEFIALSASSDLASVAVDDSNPRGAFTVDVYLANELTVATGSQVTLVQSALDDHFFGNAASGRVTAFAASGSIFDRNISIYYAPAFDLTDIRDTTESTLDDYISAIPIGGNDFVSADGADFNNIANISELFRALDAIEAVEKVVIENAGTDISLGSTGKLLPPDAWDDVVSYLELDE